MLPEAPDDAEKFSYMGRSLPYLTSALVISLVFVVLAQLLFELRNLAIAWPFMMYTFIYFAYQALSLPVNFVGRSFGVIGTSARCRNGGRPVPFCGFFLPICGEPISVLRSTWLGVRDLIDSYPGQAQAFVLDDGPGRRRSTGSPRRSASRICAVRTSATTRNQATSRTRSNAPMVSTL